MYAIVPAWNKQDIRQMALPPRPDKLPPCFVQIGQLFYPADIILILA